MRVDTCYNGTARKGNTLRTRNKHGKAADTHFVDKNDNDNDNDGGTPSLRSPKFMVDTFLYPSPNPTQHIPRTLEQGGLHRVPLANCESVDLKSAPVALPWTKTHPAHARKNLRLSALLKIRTLVITLKSSLS